MKFDYKPVYGSHYGLSGIFIWLNSSEQKCRTLVPFEAIDLGVKEENRIAKLESEIARLKGDNERLRARISTLNKEVNKWIDSSAKYRTELNQLRESAQPSPDIEKRERMAWELVINNVMSIDNCFLAVDLFLAKSKEVKDGRDNNL